jgi:nucleoside-diphosphate-sugar epimerase
MSQSQESVVVIGAGGFLGRNLLRRLAVTSAFRPIGAARRPPGHVGGFEWRMCDATDAASLVGALAGASYAVNCVAGDAAAMVAATRQLCVAARSAGLRRIVHLSSMAVYGAATGLVDEDTPLDGQSGWYAQAKVACENLVRKFVAGGGDAVILRPGCIHGPESEQWTARIGRLLRQHRIGDLGAAGDGLCNLIAVDDVAEAICAALERPDIRGHAFNLGDPDPGTWNQYFIRFGRAIGATPVSRITPRWLKIETKLLAIPLKLNQIAAAGAGLSRHAPDPLPRSLLCLWQQEIRLDHRRADSALKFARTAPDRAIADAAAWFAAQGTGSAARRASV